MQKFILVRLVAAVSFWALVLGAGMAWHEIDQQETERLKPYAVVMQEAVEGLRQSHIAVEYPKRLPALLPCSACLKHHEAFGAYAQDMNRIVVPDHFDLATPEGHAVLVHEYGHFLLTKAGVLEEKQEKLCLKLGNTSYHQFFIAALDD